MYQERDPAVLEDANLKTIEEEYKEAFAFVNKALNADELGQKEEARNYYRQGIDHLLRGTSIPSQGHECTGDRWESARQMQQKMRETLQNVTARLSILDENAQPKPIATYPPMETPRIYPTIPAKEKPERPPVPNSLLSPSHPAAAGGSAGFTSQGQAAVMSPSSAMPSEAPPAYTPEATGGHYTVSYGTDSGEFSSVGDDFYTKCTQPPPVQTLGVDADELILIPHGVQIFFVSPDGQVSAPSYPGYLRIVRFLDTEAAAAQNRPPAFLQVCDWLYPLMSNQSPVLSCSTGVYMFPDLMSQVPGSYVGVVLSSELPATDRELFEDLLKQMCDLRVQPAEASSDAINLPETVHIQPAPEERERELPDWSEKMAHGILTGASWVSWGLIKGAEYTGKAIHKGASKLREHIQPDEKPLEVNPTVAKGLHVAKQATGGAVKVSQFLVEGVCSIASCVGRELAPHVKKHGSKLVPESLKKDKDGKSTLDGALVVAASGVQGFSTIWSGLESAAKCIAKNVSKETVQTVKYKNQTSHDDHSCMYSGTSRNELNSFQRPILKPNWAAGRGAVVRRHTQRLPTSAHAQMATAAPAHVLQAANLPVTSGFAWHVRNGCKRRQTYGDDAGHATDNAVSSAINVGVAAFNIDNIGIKAIVKKTAKETGHAVLDEYKIIEKNEKKEDGY